MKVFVAGTFDYFHVGHQWLLWQAFLKGESLVVVVARDKTVKQIKGFYPHFNEQERLARVLKENIPHAEIRLGNSDGNFIKTLKDSDADLLWMGYDQCCPKGVEDIILIEKCTAYNPKIFKSSYFRKSFSINMR